MTEGVFTTVRIADFCPVWIEDHILRLKNGAEKLNIPFDEDHLINSVIKSLDKNVIPNARMRMILKKEGTSEINFEPFEDKKELFLISFKEIEPQGSLKRWPFRKHTEINSEEVILIDKSSGDVLEGSYTNIFIKKGDDFFTPPDDGKIVAGICRKYFIEYLKLKGCNIYEKRFSKVMLKNSEIFLTNALRGVVKAKLREPVNDRF